MTNDYCGVMPVYDINDNRNCGCNNDGFGNGGWIWVIFLFFIMAWGGNGWGSFGNGANGVNGAAFQGVLTRSDLCQEFNASQLENGVRGIQQGLCDGFYAQNSTMLNGFNGLQNSLCQGFSGVSSELCNGFNNLNNNVTQARFDAQNCCCETNRNIDTVRYENSKNTCDIVNAIKEDGALTRAQMTATEMQNLRDKLAERDRDVLARDYQLSQLSQTSTLIGELRPCPIPAYPACSPYYTPFGGFGYGNSCNNGCGNGCNTGCC